MDKCHSSLSAMCALTCHKGGEIASYCKNVECPTAAHGNRCTLLQGAGELGPVSGA